ncbi:MAG: T9SS type A sorting domain-containing protein [Ignavibacteriaceae bacterium]|nr:T9SS type A sorting domain-containing protein [Ignavibacteriaceae bacterium]
MKIIIISFIVYSIVAIAQVPGSAFNPMTAPGANGIDWSDHTLFWENSLDVLYNECYFSSDSSLVANLDTAVRIQNGYPSTIFSSVSVPSLLQNTKYFWSVVEYNASGNSLSLIWNFNSQPLPIFINHYDFTSNLEGWEIKGPLGFNNWYWSNGSHTGSTPGEMVFRWDPVFIGDSYIMSPEIPCPAGATLTIDFNYFEDWWSDTVVVGSAITSDNGNNWTSIWELHATGNVGPDIFYTTISAPGNFRLGFYYTGDSNNIDFLYVDNISIFTAATIPFPPSLLQAQASSTEQKVTLTWNSGSTPYPPITGYQIQRKEGLPGSNSTYVTIVETISGLSTQDETVELNHNYTYRIATISGGGVILSHYGNEATAYVPSVVPVELQNFYTEVTDNNVFLNWTTATETNNSGFEIERTSPLPSPYQGEGGEAGRGWETVGFVPGFGNTTEVHHYSFVDESLQTGKYQYRLKQIDFDGVFEYSNTTEVSIVAPAEFALEQNFPNPFNPSTKIKFEIPSVTLSEVEGSLVTLKVYDILGSEVATLVNENIPAGTHEVEFNAESHTGEVRNLPSGVYIYTLVAGSFVESKKMLLLK